MKIYFSFTSLVLMFVFVSFLSPTYGQWSAHDIDTDIDHPILLYAADIDEDGDLDLATAGEGDDDVIWYENIGGMPISWTKHIIDDNLNAAIGVWISDIDGDGDPDIASTGYVADDVVWYENIGGRPISWTKHTIDGYLNGAGCVSIADIDGDDTLDVVASGEEADDLVWYENMGGSPIIWIKHTIELNLEGALTFEVVDLDDDGDLDVIIVAKYANDVVWYENVNLTWEKHFIDANLDRAFGVGVADIDGDDTLDVVATGQDVDEVVWYENNHPTWTKHFIDDNLDGAGDLYIADIDGDDTLDIVATGLYADDVVWYENVNLTWEKHFIDEDLNGANDVITADIDDDDNQDVIVTGFSANRVVWYTNLLGIAQAKSVQSHPRFIPSEGDTLIINVQLYNPDNNPATVWSFINGEEYGYTDSVQLYDDGQHHDSLASDNLWGNSKWLSELPEDNYSIAISSHDADENYTYELPAVLSFTSIGPLKVVDYEITSSDTVPNHGDRLNYKLTLRNEGQTVTATDVTTNLINLDTCAIISGFTDKPYGDIAPGATALHSGSHTIIFSDTLTGCSDPMTTQILVEISSDGFVFWYDTLEIIVSDIEKTDLVLPKSFALSQNYPNPFNPRTIINYELPITNYVNLGIYNLLGQKVTTLVSEKQKAGHHQVEWDAGQFSSGVYYYRIEAGEFQDVKKMVLLR